MKTAQEWATTIVLAGDDDLEPIVEAVRQEFREALAAEITRKIVCNESCCVQCGQWAAAKYIVESFGLEKKP